MPHAISTPLEDSSSQSDSSVSSSSSSPGPLTPSSTPSPSPPPSYAVQSMDELPSPNVRPSRSPSPNQDYAEQPEARVTAESDVQFRVMYEFVALTAFELAVEVDEVITVIDMEDRRGWWLARKEGRMGWVPSTYLRRVDVEMAVEPEDESEGSTS